MKSIRIGDKQYIVKEHKNFERGYMCVCEDEKTFIIFKSKDEAGKCSKAFWKELASENPQVFLDALGRGYPDHFLGAAEILLKWAMGEKAGPGTDKTKSLQDWFDLFEKEPHYGKEIKGEISPDLVKELKLPRQVICYENV